MKRRDFSFARIAPVSRGFLLTALLITMGIARLGQAAPQADSDVPPDATPQIQQVNPGQAAAGAKLTVVIQGSNFSAGAYVSSVSPAVHVDSFKRVSATQLEAQLSVSASAQPSTLSLLVSNPASRAAEAAFKIVAAGTTPAPTAPAAPPTPATPVAPAAPVAPTAPAAPTQPATPSAPATPTSPAAPATPASPATPSTPPAPTTPAAPAVPAAPPGPVVTTVDPPSVGQGFDIDLKITGKNFAQGSKVSFANTGIRVTSVTAAPPNQLTVHIKVAPDATPGAGSMFVINPDDSEVETPFEVMTKGAARAVPQPATPPAPGTAATTEHYDAYHLGNPAEVFQVHGKVKGALVVTGGTLQYQEDGKTLINIALTDIHEIRTSSIATATFHVTLNSGKTYHFAPGSLRPSDARNLVDALRKDLPH